MMRHSTTSAGIALAAALLAAPAIAETRIDRDLPLAPGGRVEVDTDAGSVTVKGSEGAGVRVTVTSKDDDLEQYWDFRFEATSGVVRVVAERKEDARRWFRKTPSPSFELTVPRRSTIAVDTAGGSVRVAAIEGAVDVDTAGGHIEVSDVRGDAVLDTAGGGIEVRDLEGTLRAETSGGSIRVAGVTGDASLETSGGSITVSDAGGRLVAETSGGSIDASFRKGNGRGGSLETMGGGIVVRVDPSVGLDIDASTMGGSVSTSLPVTVQGTVKRSSLRGTLGSGGASLTASTMGGSIRIDPID